MSDKEITTGITIKASDGTITKVNTFSALMGANETAVNNK